MVESQVDQHMVRVVSLLRGPGTTGSISFMDFDVREKGLRLEKYWILSQSEESVFNIPSLLYRGGLHKAPEDLLQGLK